MCMRILFLSCLMFVALILPVTSVTDLVPQNLTETVFEWVLHRQRFAFVTFYAPWCPYSREFLPIWHDFKPIISENEELLPVNVLQVDCTVNENLCPLERVTHFPTLIWYSHGGAQWSKYEGKRTVDALLHYVEGKVYPEGNTTIRDQKCNNKK